MRYSDVDHLWEENNEEIDWVRSRGQKDLSINQQTRFCDVRESRDIAT